MIIAVAIALAAFFIPQIGTALLYTAIAAAPLYISNQIIKVSR